MNLRILSEFDYDLKLFRAVDTKTTDFAKREGMEYEGWCIEEVDCNGAMPSIYTNDGEIENLNASYPYVGIRPAVTYSEIAAQAKVINEYNNGLKEVEFGEYPQEEVIEALQEKLNQDLIDGQLEKTGKEYTIYNNDEQNPNIVKLIEVKDKDGNKYVNKHDTWYKVSPVKWMVNEQTNLAITKQMIQGGIPYGEYKLPELSEWEQEYERKHPMKFPRSVRLMYQIREINPTIIEGFLKVVLSQDLLPGPTKKIENTPWLPMDPIPGKGPWVPMDPIPGKGPWVPTDPILGQSSWETYGGESPKVKKI